MRIRPTTAGWILVFSVGIMLWGLPGIAAAESKDAASLQALIEADWIEQDRLFSQSHGIVAEAPLVTTAEDAGGGCDGVKNGRWGFHTASGETDPWWQVDLGRDLKLDRIVVFNRVDRGTAPRTKNLVVSVSSEGAAEKFREVYRHSGEPFFGVNGGEPLAVDLKDKDVTARIVRLSVPGKCSFALDEVEVYGAADPAKNLALGQPADQKSVGPYSYPGTLPEGVDQATPPGAESAAGSFSLAHIGQVLDRAGRLAERLRTTAPAKQHASLRQQLASLEKAQQTSVDQRRALYFAARQLARQIAFTNRLFDFDKILFVKRHDAVGVFHMCDQYYGCNAVPGGGLFVLHDPFGKSPRVANLLADSVVEKGRLAGMKLENGSFLSPELSFDGEEILFAFSEAKAWAKYQGKEAYEWGPEISYHLFKCNADGTGLVQLTDGPADDFDPCYLPDGRVVFVTLRRGGYLRCGRHCPVYTMHSMEPDGTDIICISYHETHEWHPSVNNEGMLVYSRWDYVDRDTNVAHHIWTCYPDGRDPRTFHGNYPEHRESRPWMEMQIRAIPGSHKYVCSTGAHHGHEFGSLVLIDPRLKDDGAMSQLERLTPDVPFPEAESPKNAIADHMIYGTPWPLSEDDYLCVYDSKAKNRGIYWIDRDGNKELLYRDPEISCVSPIPLQARPVPPVIPSATMQAARDRQGKSEEEMKSTVAVMNVYDSDFVWPAGTKIEALRVVQVLPKTTAPPNEPRIGIANQTNARAILGTVPVEADGSVFFEAPAGKELYFQVVDARGMAVQSMRSGTYLHPGEKMQCQGCHERKHQGLPEQGAVPLALRRAPSKIRPEVAGTNPFNYVRLVQPVLDRNCVACHQEKKALDLSGGLAGKNGWTQSYESLAGKYGFYYHVSNGSIKDPEHGGSRTEAGQFGARASKLLPYLTEDHYGVKLAPEELHRVTLWLDSNSEFFGSYENIEAQARGEVVPPTLDWQSSYRIEQY